MRAASRPKSRDAPWRIATQPWKVQDKFNASPSAASELYKPNAPEDDEPLTRSQFASLWTDLGIKTSPKDLRDLWRMLDADKNEAISLKEFTRFVTKEGEEEKLPKLRASCGSRCARSRPGS